MSEAGYSSWTALVAAFKATAAKSVKDGGAHDVNSQLIQARFDRFLSRVFADGEKSEWMLKGGGAMLARVPLTRGTKDLDLAASAADLDEALHALEERASVDLGDHIRFELARTTDTGQGDNQPGTQTRRAQFTAYDADTGKKIGDIPVDIVVGPPPVGVPEVVNPANRIHLPRPIPTHPYRLYPLADQVAEKVCATLSRYGGVPSSRTKDLIDLVVIARTQRLNARELQRAIDAKRLMSQIGEVSTFTVPEGWGRTYQALAKSTPSTGGITDVAEAQELVAALVNPALAPDPAPSNITWIPGSGWLAEPEPSAEPLRAPDSAGSDVWVRRHVRAGWPVSEHSRSPRGSRADP